MKIVNTIASLLLFICIAMGFYIWENQTKGKIVSPGFKVGFCAAVVARAIVEISQIFINRRK